MTMSDSTTLIAAGGLGLAWWIYHQREQERRQKEIAAYLAKLKEDASRTVVPINTLVPLDDAAAQRPGGAASQPAATKVPKATAPAPGTRSPDPSPPIAPSGPTPPITRTFDPLFAAFGPTLPTAYLRALAVHESGMQPNATSGAGRGLFSIVPIKLKDFNERHGTHFSLNDLLNPVVNVQVAAGFLRDAILAGYTKNHADVPNLREDWTNPRFVELVTLGWSAGYSERGGVGRVAAFLEQHGRRDITLDVVQATAAAAGASPALADPRRARFCRDVTATYLRERERDSIEGRPTAPPAAPFGAAPIPSTHDPK
jgi:hypothetical protein